jgi:methylamine--corrinoid protein Co-methyltransferase
MLPPDYYDYDALLAVLDKAENGPFVEEKDWDRQYINQKIKALVKQYDITWDRNDPGVPADDALADRTWAAGMDLALSSGLYCLETRRQMLWTQAELERVLSRAPASVTFGLEPETVTISRRRPDENSRVATVGGAYGTQVPEELFVPVMLSYAQERVLDFIDNASLISSYGRQIRASSPWEAVGCWQEMLLSFEVVQRAGRPGMPIGCAEDSPSAIGELATTTFGAFRPSDWHHASFVSELKTSYAELTKAVHYAHTGSAQHNFYNPIYGGFVGGGPGMAVATVAGMVLMKAAYNGITQNPGPSHAHLSCDTFPDMITSQAVAFQALSRNSNILVSAFVRPVGGPGTKDILYETAAMTLASVPSGIALMEGVQSAMGRHTAHVSGLEARFMGEVAHAAQGLTRKEADPLVRRLIASYAPGQAEMRIGQPFDKVYDLDTVQPTPDWLRLYEEVRQELAEMGLELG